MLKSSFALMTGGLCLLCLPSGAFAKKAPHIPGVVTEPTVLVGALFQDLSLEPIVIEKTIYNEYTPIDTKLTINLTQDARGHLVGHAEFESSHPNGGTSLDVNGKIKTNKKGSGFNLNGSTEVTADSSGDDDEGESATPETKTISLKVSAVATHFSGQPLAEVDYMNDGFSAETTYYVKVRISGLGFKYNYGQEIEVTGLDCFGYDLAPLDQVNDKKDKPNSDYYFLATAWGTAMAEGTFQLIGTDGVFTLKGPKFKYIAVDHGFDGWDFTPDTATLKTGMGKYEGPVGTPIND